MNRWQDRVDWEPQTQGEAAGAGSASPSSGEGAGTPYLRLWFRCAGQYVRAYRQRDGRAYAGRCPKCGGTIRFPIGPGGTSDRAFEVSC